MELGSRLAFYGRVDSERAAVLFLDVGGVLNPFASDAYPAGFEPYDLFAGEEPVHLNPAHGALITELGKVFEVVWATSWNDEANTLLAPILRIAPLPVVRMPAAPFEPAAKLPPVAAYAADRPAAWIEDVHASEGRAWAASRDAPTLLLTTDPCIGLTNTLTRVAVAWAVEHAKLL